MRLRKISNRDNHQQDQKMEDLSDTEISSKEETDEETIIEEGEEDFKMEQSEIRSPKNFFGSFMAVMVLTVAIVIYTETFQTLKYLANEAMPIVNIIGDGFSFLFFSSLDATCKLTINIFNWNEKEVWICNFSLFLQNLRSMMFSVWDLLLLPFRMLNDWLGIDSTQLWKENPICPGAEVTKSWLKQAIIGLSMKFGANGLALHNLNIISDFITVNVFLFLCSFELNSTIIWKLFVPQDDTSLLEGFKNFIGFDGNYIVSFIIRTLFILSVFVWALLCKLTIGTIVVWGRFFLLWSQQAVKESSLLNSRWAKSIFRLLPFRMLTGLISVIMFSLRLAVLVVHICTFGWISIFQLLIWTSFLLLLSTLWCGFQFYFFWDQTVQGTQEQLQKLADTIFERAANFSEEDIAKLRLIGGQYNNQKYLG